MVKNVKRIFYLLYNTMFQLDSFSFDSSSSIESIKKNHYRIILLIISSNDGEHSIVFQEYWRKYMNSHPNIKCFFLTSDVNIPTDVWISNDTITYKQLESFEPGILYKTIAGMKVCEKYFTYDYILRTNLSSFFILDRLYSFLDSQPTVNYAATAPKELLSGAGFILSSDLVTFFLNEIFEKNALSDDILYYPDDVVITIIVKRFFHDSSSFSSLNRYDCEEFVKPESIGEEIFHIRNKTEWKYGNRLLDMENMKKLYEYFYGHSW